MRRRRRRRTAVVPVVLMVSVIFALALLSVVSVLFGMRHSTLANGVQFVGKVEGGVPVKGTAYFESGSAEYDQATSTLRYHNGDVYVGEVKDLVPHGQGKMVYASGTEYEGAFVKGKFEGQGSCRYASGEEYVGEWKGGLRQGQGTFVWNISLRSWWEKHTLQRSRGNWAHRML